MIILEKSHCIMFYSVNPKYFDKFSGVSCGISGRSYWRTSEANTNTFTHHIHFLAKDEQGGESFIEYKGRMVCTVKIENEKQDALQMLTLIKDFHTSMNSFIKNNSLLHFSKLDIQAYQITEPALTRMEASIAGLKDMKLYEDKSEFDKKLEHGREDMEFNVKIIKIKTTID